MSLSEQELKNEINNEKRGNYILLSSWYGRRTPGYNGIIVNLDTQDVKEYYFTKKKIEQLSSIK